VARVVGVRPAFVTGCLASAASLGVVGCGGQPSSSTFPPASCSLPQVAATGSASATAGLRAHGAAVPVWSAAIGRPSVVEDGTAYATRQGHCIVAVDVATGRLDWIAAPTSEHPELFDVVADGSTVLAAAGIEVGQAPAAVFPVVAQLTAYDPTTGHSRWAVVIPSDGQGMPGLLTGSVVVVSQADGSVLGLKESDGHPLWRDHAPAGCASNSTRGLQPNAAMIGMGSPRDGTSAIIAYACPAGGSIAAIDPVNGARRWNWRVPQGWNVDAQMAATVDTGNPDGHVVAVPISLVPAANAPPIVAPAPGPSHPTKIANVYGYSETSDVVVLDPSTGRPLWDLIDVAGQALTAVGGAGSLCILTDAGADCRGAQDGAPLWSMTWPGRNASATHPALSCIDQAAREQPCAVSANGFLYLALATESTPAYPPTPGPPTSSGSFVITALSMATGKTIATLPLPSFNNLQSDHSVSLALPPAILMVADGMVLVSPQFQETDVVEAFSKPSSG
jgi:outer membrane protein assembly factor BamB